MDSTLRNPRPVLFLCAVSLRCTRHLPRFRCHGSCGSHHDWCDSGQLQLAGAVIDAVDREDVNYLSGLVTASTAVIVESRQAIQIPGCDGEFIVGHVPVGDALMASLRVAVSKLTDL